MLPKIFNWISVASFLMLCMVYIYFVNTYTINTPYLDDTSLIDFLFQVTQKDVTWSKFFQAFFRSDNDHCLAIPRLIILLDYWLNNSINYTHFIILINCLIFVILYFFYIEFKQIKVSFYYFLPVVLLWLQPQYYEVAFWGLTGMQHTILTIFVLLIIQLIYSQKKSHYIIAMIIGLLATFTHGNGILSYPTALFILLIQRRLR